MPREQPACRLKIEECSPLPSPGSSFPHKRSSNRFLSDHHLSGAANDPPIANDDTTSTPEDTAVVVDVVGNDFDVDANLDPTTVVITSSPSNGTVDVDPATGEVTYTP